MTTDERINMFTDILGMIKRTEMLNFAKTILTNADDYFFEMPASTTGKYHPAFALGDGGLVRHTKAVAMIAATMAESLDYGEEDSDALIVAAIAHDIKKKGNGGGKWTTKDHPLCAYEYVKSLPHDGLSDEMVDKIAGAVKTHMGKWGDFKPETEFQKTLQEADLIASRKWLDIKFPDSATPVNLEANAPVAPALNESAAPVDPGSMKLWFGKYNGLTISEVYEKEPSYLTWGVNNFYQESLRSSISNFLKSKK